jgi:hypothetical protein
MGKKDNVIKEKVKRIGLFGKIIATGIYNFLKKYRNDNKFININNDTFMYKKKKEYEVFKIKAIKGFKIEFKNGECIGLTLPKGITTKNFYLKISDFLGRNQN